MGSPRDAIFPLYVLILPSFFAFVKGSLTSVWENASQSSCGTADPATPHNWSSAATWGP